MYLTIHVRFGKHAFEKLDQPLRQLVAARLHFPLIRHPFLIGVHHAADVALVAALVASTHNSLALKTSNHSQKWSRVCVVQIVLRRSGNREQVVPAHALSLERQQRANELTAVLGGLVDRGVARFATGEIELNDETYAAWLSELKAAGSDELVAMYH